MAVRFIASKAEKILERVLCVLAAILFSQGPEFMQQYLQRLGGHVDEARHQVYQFQIAASKANLSLPSYIEKTRNNSDLDIALLGDIMAASVAREEKLSRAQSALVNASAFTRPFVFMRYVDVRIADATVKFYKPAVPTTVEGFLYAGGGLLLFLFIYHYLIKAPIKRLIQRHRERKKTLSNEPEPSTSSNS